MAKDDKDWNFDRMYSAQALISEIQNEIMRCLHRGEVVGVVRDRMLQHLQGAQREVEWLKLTD